MKNVFTLCFTLILTGFQLNAQNLNLPPASKQAAVAEWIGLTKVAVHYHRPGVKGRDGQIFGGTIVPFDEGNPIPWRAGANENTTIYFGDAVTINGQELPAGKYGFHTIPGENEWTLIFSKNNHSWGSYFYDKSEDALRVTAKPSKGEFTEWLSYDFVNQTDNSADIRLRWDYTQVSFTVGVNVHEATMASLSKQLEGLDGFNPQSYAAAAQYCVNSGKDLETALTWSDRSIDPNFGGQKTFQTMSTRYMVLSKMEKKEDAKSAWDESLALGNMTELHQWARQMIGAGQNEKALKVFKINRERNPDDKYTTVVGLARGNMANGNYEEAAKYFKKATEGCPPQYASFYEDLAKQCEEKLHKGG